MRFTTTAWAALALVAAGASAQTPETRLQAAFQEADVNDDGVVDVDEFVGYVVKMFEGLDANKDGMLRMADVPNVDPARFAAVDRDGDGMVSLGEAVAERIILFFEMDANRDGVITFEELLNYEQILGQ